MSFNWFPRFSKCFLLELLTRVLCLLANYCPHYPPQYRNMEYEGLHLYLDGHGIRVGSVLNGYCDEGYYRLSSSTLVVSGICTVLEDYESVFGECTSKSGFSYYQTNIHTWYRSHTPLNRRYTTRAIYTTRVATLSHCIVYY